LVNLLGCWSEVDQDDREKNYGDFRYWPVSSKSSAGLHIGFWGKTGPRSRRSS